MNRSQQIEVIRAACVKANPEIDSSVPHCGSCLDEKDLGYGDGMDFCCCLAPHVKHPRPVRLADVLLAIKQKDTDMERTVEEMFGGGGAVCNYLYSALQAFASMASIRKEFWNLHSDDLTLQNDDTISFLYELVK